MQMNVQESGRIKNNATASNNYNQSAAENY